MIDFNHCVICNKPHDWHEETFLSGHSYKQQIYWIACDACKPGIKLSADSQEFYVRQVVQMLLARDAKKKRRG